MLSHRLIKGRHAAIRILPHVNIHPKLIIMHQHNGTAIVKWCYVLWLSPSFKATRGMVLLLVGLGLLFPVGLDGVPEEAHYVPALQHVLLLLR